MRKGKKVSQSHTWIVLTVNDSVTFRAMNFYYHKLMTGKKKPTLARRAPLLGKDHWPGTGRGRLQVQINQDRPETEPFCSQEKPTVVKRVAGPRVELSSCYFSHYSHRL